MNELTIEIKIIPSFGPGIKLVLKKCGVQKIIQNIEYEIGGYVGKSGVAKLSSDQSNKIFNMIKNLQLPVLPSVAMGLDGVTYCVKLSSYMNSVEYSWWGDAPESYQILKKLIETLIDYLDIDEYID